MKPTTQSGRRSLAEDSTLIKGIYEACDQWCMYCALTDRCFAFRVSGADKETGIWDTFGDDDPEEIGEGVGFAKWLADAEGRPAPPEIEAIVSKDRAKQMKMFTLQDPLERLGRSYMNLAEAYLGSDPDFPFDITRRASGPTPLEVVAWFHVLAPARIFRAILNEAEAADGVPGRYEDAQCAAKVALIGIDRSLDALVLMAAEDDDPRLELMQDHLRRLRPAVEARFPGARGFVRDGLDTPHNSGTQERPAGSD